MLTDAPFSLEIRYCVSWNYKPKAASLAEKLKEEYECEVTIIPGNRGEFSIWIYDKRSNNSDNKESFFIVGKEGFDFPSHDKVIALTDKIIEQII